MADTGGDIVRYMCRRYRCPILDFEISRCCTFHGRKWEEMKVFWGCWILEPHSQIIASIIRDTNLCLWGSWIKSRSGAGSDDGAGLYRFFWLAFSYLLHFVGYLLLLSVWSYIYLAYFVNCWQYSIFVTLYSVIIMLTLLLHPIEFICLYLCIIMFSPVVSDLSFFSIY